MILAVRNSWLVSALTSWIAGVAALASLSFFGVGDLPSLTELPLALAGSLAVQTIVCALVFEPALRISRRLRIPELGPLLVIGLGGLSLLAFMAAFDGGPTDLATPAAIALGGFFITGAAVFGLMRQPS